LPLKWLVFYFYANNLVIPTTNRWQALSMTLRIAINGFGRIGRNVLRALYTQGYRQDLQIVAINDLGDSTINAHLLKYDTVHGTFDANVEHDQESLTVNGDRISVTAIRNPAELPWAALNIDVVFECTGLFTERSKAQAHITAGARKVIISAPGKNADATVVYGVNHDILRQSHQIISNASCTTNCLAPVAQILHREFGIANGLMTTIHAYTNDQNLTDVYHSRSVPRTFGHPEHDPEQNRRRRSRGPGIARTRRQAHRHGRAGTGDQRVAGRPDH
jgi:glyceraldehyde 3-phosphate dehydrogenase